MLKNGRRINFTQLKGCDKSQAMQFDFQTFKKRIRLTFFLFFAAIIFRPTNLDRNERRKEGWNNSIRYIFYTCKIALISYLQRFIQRFSFTETKKKSKTQIDNRWQMSWRTLAYKEVRLWIGPLAKLGRFKSTADNFLLHIVTISLVSGQIGSLTSWYAKVFLADAFQEIVSSQNSKV